MNAQADAQVLGSAYRTMWKLPPHHCMPEISTGHPITKSISPGEMQPPNTANAAHATGGFM